MSRGAHANAKGPVVDVVAGIDSLFDAADKFFGVDSQPAPRTGRGRSSAAAQPRPVQVISADRTLGRGNAWTVTEATSETGVQIWMVADGNGGVAICNSPVLAEMIRSRL